VKSTLPEKATTTEMKVPLLDLKLQYASIKAELDAAMLGIAASQQFILGSEVEKLENELASYSRSPHAIGCASGSDALLLALMALGVKAGDEVVCPSYTFFATAGAISRLGAFPVFADIDPATYNMDPLAAREAVQRCKRLKAIIPVHLFGLCADMAAYEKIAREFKAPLIEDAAQAIGSEDAAGRRAGSIGMLGCLSFFPSKNLGCFGDGGMITTNDPALAESMRVLRVHGMQPKYYHKYIGINSRLDALQAAVLSVKLKYLDAWTAGRIKNAGIYQSAFIEAGAQDSRTPISAGGFPLRVPYAIPGARHIYNQYIIRVPANRRDALRDYLKLQNVGTEIYYPLPLHRQECFSDLGYAAGSLPHSEAAAAETIALPIFPELTSEQLNHVAAAIIRFLSKRD
jgi:dTDP-4-amino-4,6-dideoxygalactose transaminase